MSNFYLISVTSYVGAEGDWSRFAYPVQWNCGISVDVWSDQPLVPALFFRTPAKRLSQEPQPWFCLSLWQRAKPRTLTSNSLRCSKFQICSSFRRLSRFCTVFPQSVYWDIWSRLWSWSFLSIVFICGAYLNQFLIVIHFIGIPSYDVRSFILSNCMLWDSVPDGSL